MQRTMPLLIRLVTCVFWVQVQASLITGRRQLEELHNAAKQHEQQTAELSQQVAALQSERAAAAEEARSAQQELQRVLRELDQCLKVRAAHEGMGLHAS